MYTCQYCNKECKSKLSKSCHERFCKLNPNYEQNIKVHIEKVSSKAVEASIKAVKEKAANDPLNQIHTYKFTCFRCGKEYELKLKERDYLHGNYRKTCSSKCAHANATNLSEETKKRKSEKIKQEHEHICPKCGVKFLHKGTSTNTFCPNCRKKLRIKSQNIGLHQIICKDCGKPIFVKAADAKYCYDCSKKNNMKSYQIYDQNGKKVVSDSYRKKMSDLAKKLMEEGKIKPWQSRNIKSYAERFFEKVLSLNNIQFQREEKVDKYFLDFVIETPNRIIDFEVDGKQHWNDQERVESDKVRDEYLSSIGYFIYRLPWNEINSPDGKSLMKDKITKFLDFYKNSFI